MTHNGSDLLSRRAVLGTAGVAFAVPLIGDQPASGARPMKAARQLGSLAELAQPTGADGVGTLKGSLASVVDMLPLDARGHGVVGDGHIDDTRAVQAFLDLCAEQGGRIAYFGSLIVRITGPLKTKVGIVFDPASYGSAGTPGFVASGRDYTALTVLGSVADFCVTLTGDGTADITEEGHIAGDRRPAINGIAFGTDDEPFAMSTVRAVRVNNLAGIGIRHAQCWDSTFLSVSVERCGTAKAYAFEVAGDSRRSCNETTWARIHVEQAMGGAIRIDPGTLSCTFVKIHSERAIARAGIPTWFFGGSCVYDSVRLTAANPTEAGLTIVSNQAEFRNLRAEQEIRVTVNASGGTVNFHNPGAVMQPAPNQSGIINIVGGVLSILGMGGGWNLFGSQIGRLEVGFMPAGMCSTLTGCVVAELVPQGGTDQGELVLNTTRVAAATLAGAGRLRALHLNANTRLTGKDGALHCVDQTVAVDASSRIEGSLTLQRATLRLAGTVTGNLTVQGAVHDVRAADGAVVGGTVTGWGPPSVAANTGAWSVNLAATAARAGGRIVIGWRSVAGKWRPIWMDGEG